VKVLIGVGFGAKSTVGPVEVRAELATKANVQFSNGKLSASHSVEGGASVGYGKREVGLAGSAEKVDGAYNVGTGQVSGPEPAGAEWVIGTQRGGTAGSGNQEKLALGGEAGDIALAGGEASITKDGVEHLQDAFKEALNEVEAALLPGSSPPAEQPK
jgi:hypothetical protein